MKDCIQITNARTHNLKNVDVSIPHGKITLICGPSGAGKSSLAVDTLHQESRKRYTEALAGNLRFLMNLEQSSDVDDIQGLTPSICLKAEVPSLRSRSTLGTISECTHYLRVLFAGAAQGCCPECGRKLKGMHLAAILQQVKEFPEGTKLQILTPIATAGQSEEELETLRQNLVQKGYVRIMCFDGDESTMHDLAKPGSLKNDVSTFVVIDRIKLSERSHSRMADSFQTAMQLGETQCALYEDSSGEWLLHHFSEEARCPEHNISLPVPQPKSFSTENPRSCCLRCTGTGELNSDDSDAYDLSSGKPVILPCPDCEGKGLKQELLHFHIGKKDIGQITALPVESCLDFIHNLPNTGWDDALIGLTRDTRRQLTQRLQTLVDLGLGYLQLSRKSHTLSGGELQRVRLAAQLGSGLTQLTCILDEPTQGLSAKDAERVFSAVRKMQEDGCTMILIEHNPGSSDHADYLIEMGPGAAEQGGDILFEGSMESAIKEHKKTPERIPTFQWLKRSLVRLRPAPRTPEAFIQIQGASGHSLKQVDAQIPMGCFTVMSGPSGSGKSSLLLQTLEPALAYELGQRKRLETLPFQELTNPGIQRVIGLSQKALGRQKRSTLATQSGLMDILRDMFAGIPESKARGYKAGRFSRNSKGGRCEHCKGAGDLDLEMNYLDNTSVTCPYCEGSGYNRETLEITFKGYNIAEYLSMPVETAMGHLRNIPKAYSLLKPLRDLGLGYLSLGEPSAQISGGEAQRIRLAMEIGKALNTKTTPQKMLFLLDEPARGLYFSEVELVLQCIEELCKAGHTVVAIEHNEQFRLNADWEIEMGPEAGEAGGEIIYQGALRES